MIADGVAEAFQLQGLFCQQLGSPLYATLLGHCHQDILAGGLVSEIVDGWQGNAMADVLPLRFLGAVHRLVLDGRVPDLARYYPSAGGQPEWPELWTAFRTAVDHHREFIRGQLNEQVQTNEVSRSAALLGAFLQVAAQTRLPLRLLEIGSSAGLNLNWDRYRYELGDQTWGDPSSPVLVRSQWHGSPKYFQAAAIVDGRFGCDLSPIDVRDPKQVRTLESFLWPDQRERLVQLRAAIELARKDPPRLVLQTASAFLRDQLSRQADDATTVVFHSTMWWYLPAAERDLVTRIIEDRGSRATRTNPLAWVQLEVRDQEKATLTVRLWPTGDERVLATSHPHGREVWWTE